MHRCSPSLAPLSVCTLWEEATTTHTSARWADTAQAYVPGVAGRLPRSLVADMVAVYAQRLSVQERLTRQLAHAVTAAATLPRAVVEAATGAEVLEQLPACSMTAGWTGSPSHPRQPGEPQPSHTADGADALTLAPPTYAHHRRRPLSACLPVVSPLHPAAAQTNDRGGGGGESR